jgi:hypothetical protein
MIYGSRRLVQEKVQNLNIERHEVRDLLSRACYWKSVGQERRIASQTGRWRIRRNDLSSMGVAAGPGFYLLVFDLDYDHKPHK